MKRLLGYTLLGVGLLAFVFFLNYRGTAIPERELWFVLSLFVMVAGAYFVVKHRMGTPLVQSSGAAQNNLADHLKQTGELIKVTLENAEVKTRTLRQDRLNNSIPSRVEMLDALQGDSRNYRTEEVQQTYIVLHRTYGNQTYKFISRAMSQDALAVKRYMETNGGINLYVDRGNPGLYYFDLPFV